MKNIFILIFFYNFGFSQTDFNKSIEIYYNPLLTNFNYFKQDFIKTQDSRISFHENYTLNSEFGLNINLKKSKFLVFGIGASYKTYKYSFNSSFQRFPPTLLDTENNYDSRFLYQNKLVIKALGLRGLVNMKIFNSTSMSVILEFNKPISAKTLVPINEGNFGSVIYNYNERLSQNIKSIKHYIVPELNFKTKIHENIFLNYGFKLKFWKGKEYLYELNIHTNNNGFEEYTLLDYKIDTRQIGFYCGLNYKFLLKKRN